MDKRERWLEAQRWVDEVREIYESGEAPGDVCPCRVVYLVKGGSGFSNEPACPIHGDRLTAISARYDQMVENDLSRGE